MTKMSRCNHSLHQSSMY